MSTKATFQELRFDRICMTFAVLRIRLVPCQNVFCSARSLSGQARNRTWNLPSPSSTPSTSGVPESPSQRARPSPQAPRKQSRPRRDTHIMASRKPSPITKNPSRDDTRRIPVESTKQTKYTPKYTQRENPFTKPIAPKPETSWAAHKAALKAKFPEGWHPDRKISPEAMEGIRILHRQVRPLSFVLWF
jgi:hypothetical protein